MLDPQAALSMMVAALLMVFAGTAKKRLQWKPPARHRRSLKRARRAGRGES
jgi:hypothetical protein